MHKTIQNILGGLAGSLAITALNEVLAKTVTNAPRIDEVGEEALTKILSALDITPPKGKQLFTAALGADLASNALYYSVAGTGNDKYILHRGGTLGLLAGISVLTITAKIGLDDKPVTKTLTTQCMTVAYYLAAGLIAGMFIKAIRINQNTQQPFP